MKRIPIDPIKVARRHFGWTQERMASEMGVDVRTLARYEAGKATPMALKLVELMVEVVVLRAAEKGAYEKILASSPEHATEDGDMLCVSG